MKTISKLFGIILILILSCVSNIAVAIENIDICDDKFSATKCVFKADRTSSAEYKTSAMPAGYKGVNIEIKTESLQHSDAKKEDVFRVQFYQIDPTSNKKINKLKSTPIRTFANAERVIELESCYFAKENLPIYLKIERLCDDPADTSEAPVLLAGIKVSTVKKLPEPIVVENKKGYNSWPMIQAWKGKLFYLYTRGSGHTIGEGSRDTFLKISSDNGKTWSKEIPFATDQLYGEVPIGKGLDENGNITKKIKELFAYIF